MTVVRRVLTAAAALLCVLVCLTAGAGGAAAAGSYAADRVVVAGVPGLAWSDVGPAATPELWSLAGSSAIGALSVRSARSTTCVLDGWATLGAGNRARFPGADDPSVGHCGPQQQAAARGFDPPQAVLRAIGSDAATRRFGSEPGALGEAVGCAATVGAAASLAAAGPGVRLTGASTVPGTPGGLGRLLSACPLGLVSLDALVSAGPDPTRTDAGRRRAAVTAVDGQIGVLRQAVDELPGRTLLVVAGISEVDDGRPRLHVGIVSGPGFSGGELTSASTGRAPYVQLIDVAPTVLRALGRAQPPSMNGQPATATRGRPALADAVERLERADVAAGVHYRSTADYFWTLVGLEAVVVLGAVLLLGGVPRRAGGLGGLWRTPGEGRGGARSRAVVRIAALAAAALPVAGHLAGLVPWERSGAARWALLGAVALADLAVLAVAALGPWRRWRLGPPAAVLAVTLGTVVADVLTGSRLELNGLLGYDAIVAGRFVGYGNLAFALLMTAALLLTPALALAAGRRAGQARERSTVFGVALLAGVLVVALDGAPTLGRDFGGVLSAVPGFLVLALLLARIRITGPRLAAVLGTAVVVVSGVAFLDWLRPAADRSHLGRFVEQVLTGEAGAVVARKAQGNLAILVHSPLIWLVPVAAVAALWLVRPGGVLRAAGRGGAVFRSAEIPALRAGLAATALTLALGSLVNDSGVAVAATGAALVVPLLVWCAAALPVGAPHPGRTAPGEPADGPAGEPGRVTVGSRGSTVWNT